jgi:hypothetical protein
MDPSLFADWVFRAGQVVFGADLSFGSEGSQFVLSGGSVEIHFGTNDETEARRASVSALCSMLEDGSLRAEGEALLGR